MLRFDDGSCFRFPALRWSESNFRQRMPTVNMSRGTRAPADLPRALRGDLDAVTFVPLDAIEPTTIEASLAANCTDGLFVLHRGRVAYERHFGVLGEEGLHGPMSVTKSVVGLLAATRGAEGTLDPSRQVAECEPELGASGFGDATVRQVMDMTTGIRFSEVDAAPEAAAWAHVEAGNPLPKPERYAGPRSHHDFLVTVQCEGRHGTSFAYRTANADAVGCVVACATVRTVAHVSSERVWRTLGAEQDACMTVDSTGTPLDGGGLNAGLRDLARFGETVRMGGRNNGQQIVPAEAIADARRGGRTDDFATAGHYQLPGWSHRGMWWVTHDAHDAHGAFGARGVHGQTLCIDPAAEMVVARFAPHPVAANAANDATSLPA
jgi:hypothetical protein